MKTFEVVSALGKWILEAVWWLIGAGVLLIVAFFSYIQAVNDFKAIKESNAKPATAAVDIEIHDGLVLLRDGPRLITIRTGDAKKERNTTDPLLGEPSDQSVAMTKRTATEEMAVVSTE